MKHRSTVWISVVLLVAVCLLLPCASQVQGQTDTWPKYHRDPGNSGFASPDDLRTQTPGITGLELVWTYPWPMTEEHLREQIVDDQDTRFVRSPNYVSSTTLTEPSPNAYEEHYWFVPVRTPNNLNEVPTAVATWYPDLTGVPAGQRYLIYVWVPSPGAGMPNSTHVEYSIRTAGGEVFKETISQGVGGQWIQLGTRSYPLDDGSSVAMTNYSEARVPSGPPIPGEPNSGYDYVDEGRFAIADAIRLVSDSGSIYSSPAVYESPGLPLGAEKAVVFGVVDRDPAGRKTDEEINWSRVVAVDAKNGPGRSGLAQNTALNRPLWEYPRMPSQRSSPLEGPIAGAIFSSPLVVDTSRGKTVFIGADDGQVYALNALNGNLVWSGPGKTLDDASAGVSSNGFSAAGQSGGDYFGQDYRVTDASRNSDSRTITYNFSGLQDYYYNIQAWIPAVRSGEVRVRDANYKVDATGDEVTVKVDQDLCSRPGSECADCAQGTNGGRWVQIGSSPFFPDSGSITVTLTSNTVNDSCGGSKRTVVADAIRLIPQHVQAFGYNSPTASTVTGTVGRIFVSNSSGRIMALNAAGNADGSTNMEWIFPATRTASDGSDEVGLGGMAMTPAVEGTRLYYGSTTGNVGALQGIDGGSPSASWQQLTNFDDDPITDLGSITSSPMIDGGFVYFATSKGYVYKVNRSNGQVDTAGGWPYPGAAWGTDPTNPTRPPVAGAFRYSTPAKAVVNGVSYLVIGSSDGYLHQIPMAGPGPVRKIQGTGPIYSAPATAVADGTDPEAAYFGTQSGLVLGVSLDEAQDVKWGWNTEADAVFSSPGISDHFVYAGGDDGKMYAFIKSSNNGGAGWPIGDPSIPVNPPGQTVDPDQLEGGSGYFDLEVVSHADYHNPENYLATSGVLTRGSANRHPNGTPHHRFEWGETVYLLAWTYDNRNAQITFRMNNVGQGEQAGSIMTATQSAHHSYSGGEAPEGAEEGKDYYYARFAWVLDPGKLMTPGDSYVITGLMRATQGENRQSATAQVPDFDSNVSSLDTNRGSTPAQEFFINSPLAVSTFGISGHGWNGAPGRPFQPTRTDPGTLINGGFGVQGIPTIQPPGAPHGGNSRPEMVFLADRSMLGYARPNNPQGLINNLRADSGDLAFPSAPINALPWEDVPTPGTISYSRDYPDMARTQLSVRKGLDGADPRRGAALLLPTTGPATGTADQRYTNPDPLEMITEVPRYQPANRPGAPYNTRVRAWIDASGSGLNRGSLDLADQRVTGRPINGSEVYREWFYAVDVLPDFNMYAEERTIDLGKRPVGFGVWASNDFLPFASFPSSQFFKTFTIRNNGNVNLTDLRVLNTTGLPWVDPRLRFLFSDQVQAVDLNNNGQLDPGEGFALSAQNIVSSLDPPFAANPATAPFALPVGTLGHVVSKPLVGDLGPTTLRIPDNRQYNWLKANDPATNWPEPALPMISVQVPIGTPTGTYSQVVPVVAGQPDVSLNMTNPGTNPSMSVIVNVREARLTDGITSGSMPNVDIPVGDPVPPQWGDAQPAAFRLWSGTPGNVQTGSMGMLWSSNRDPSSPSTPAGRWNLFSSALQYDDSLRTFVPQTSGGMAQWWTPAPAGGGWPTDSDLAALFPGPPNGLAGNVIPASVRFTGPSAGQDLTSGDTWLVFAGQAQKSAGGTVNSEHRIFYGRPDSSGLLDPATVSSIPTQNATLPKFSPRIAVHNGRLFVFYYANVGGRFQLFYTGNSSNGAPGSWSPDAQLELPEAVTAAAEPAAFFRPNLAEPDFERSRDRRDTFIDVIYSGIVKQRGNSDLLLSRFEVNGTRLSDSELPRVFEEEMVRDTRSIGTYISRHIGWDRPSGGSGDSDDPVIRVLRWDPAAGAYLAPDVISTAPVAVDRETDLVQYDTSGMFGNRYGRVMLDFTAGTLKFEKPLPVRDRVVVDYTPETYRMTTGAQADMAPYAFLEKTLRPVGSSDPSIFPRNFSGPLSVDRMWIFWRQGEGALQSNTIYYKTLRLGLHLGRPVAVEADGSPTNLEINVGDAGPYDGPWEFDWANNRILFPAEAENLNIWVTYTSSDGRTYEEPQGFTKSPYKPLGWIRELEETAMPVDSMVNEGQVFAFADPDGLRNPSDPLYKPSLIWVFWTSSRSGSTDLYYQSLSPNFRAVTRSASP